MKVMQLIDSLDAGGAERIAVTFANTLSKELDASHLCVTRAEGILKREVQDSVHFQFIKKKSTLDLGAIWRLRNYVKRHKIGLIHAHGTSYFMVTLVKLLHPKVHIVWHAHYGERIHSKFKNHWMLYFCSLFFRSIITVNQELQDWCLQKLNTRYVQYLPNFVTMPGNGFPQKVLRKDQIVCLANLKTPKNHLNLVKAFHRISDQFPSWSLLLVGKDFQDAYSDSVRAFIKEVKLENKVVFLGQQEDVYSVLLTAKIGVLASDSEGLPMALLEYGVANLAVVVTDVGHCAQVVSNYGTLVPAVDFNALSEGLAAYMRAPEKRELDSDLFSKHVQQYYSATAVLPKLISIYNQERH